MDTLKNVDLYEVELQYMQGLRSPVFSEGGNALFWLL